MIVANKNFRNSLFAKDHFHSQKEENWPLSAVLAQTVLHARNFGYLGILP